MSKNKNRFYLTSLFIDLNKAEDNHSTPINSARHLYRVLNGEDARRTWNENVPSIFG